MDQVEGGYDHPDYGCDQVRSAAGAQPSLQSWEVIKQKKMA
jgi:hypothetical protein